MANALKKRKKCMGSSGFTLVELMIVILISSVVIAALYMMFSTQSRAVANQVRVSEIQQNLRTAMYIIEQEIRQVGYNPEYIRGDAAPGISVADVGYITFQADLNENGAGFNNVAGVYGDVYAPDNDPGEVRSIGIRDANGDGINDDAAGRLFLDIVTGTRVDGAGNTINDDENRVIAENIDAVNFVFLDRNNVPAATASDVRMIQVTIVGRASTTRPGYLNRMAYTNPDGVTVFDAGAVAGGGDGFERRVLSKTIYCANLGF